MKFSSLFIFIILCAALTAGASAQTTSAFAQESAPQLAGTDEDFNLERQVVVEPGVALTLCLASGDVVVRGWDRREVRARANGAETLKLQTDAGTTAKRVEVLIAEDSEAELGQGDCGTTRSLELDVPRDAVVTLRVHEGNVEVSGVAEARVESLTGDVNVERVSRLVEVSCLSGDISLSNATGRVHLRTVSGSVEASNVRAVQTDNDLWVGSTSGDITLEGITHARVQGSTISGNVLLSGALSRGGSYDLKTTSGDVTLELPGDASFRINARVVASGEIITDFPVKTNGNTPMPPNAPNAPNAPSIPATPGTPVIAVAPPVMSSTRTTPRTPGKHADPREPGQTRLVGVVGTGDAQVSISSFSGTLYLKKQ